MRTNEKVEQPRIPGVLGGRWWGMHVKSSWHRLTAKTCHSPPLSTADMSDIQAANSLRLLTSVGPPLTPLSPLTSPWSMALCGHATVASSLVDLHSICERPQNASDSWRLWPAGPMMMNAMQDSQREIPYALADIGPNQMTDSAAAEIWFVGAWGGWKCSGSGGWDWDWVQPELLSCQLGGSVSGSCYMISGIRFKAVTWKLLQIGV